VWRHAVVRWWLTNACACAAHLPFLYDGQAQQSRTYPEIVGENDVGLRGTGAKPAVRVLEAEHFCTLTGSVLLVILHMNVPNMRKSVSLIHLQTPVGSACHHHPMYLPLPTVILLGPSYHAFCPRDLGASIHRHIFQP